MAAEPKLGLVLSGGGARGAYEVGVLRWLAEHRPAVLDGVRVATGASVGAVNAAFMASHGMGGDAVEGLVSLWSGLTVDRVLLFSIGRLGRKASMGPLSRVLGPKGLFDTGPYQHLIAGSIDWPRLRSRIRERHLDALAVATTEIASGRTHVFVDHHDGLATPVWPNDESLTALRTPIGPSHVLASTALPFLFSPVRIGDVFYCDGGLRQNTPLSPALRLGADRLLALSVKSTHDAAPRPGVFPGWGHLAGKLFDSIFLDRMLWDVDRLGRVNDVLAAATRVGGPELVARLQAELVHIGRRPYRPVTLVNVRPSEDLGAIAARLLESPGRLRSRLGWAVRRLLRDRSGVADLASYLLFDGAYADTLIALGYRDAAAQQGELDGLLRAPEPTRPKPRTRRPAAASV